MNLLSKVILRILRVTSSEMNIVYEEIWVLRLKGSRSTDSLLGFGFVPHESTPLFAISLLSKSDITDLISGDVSTASRVPSSG